MGNVHRNCHLWFPVMLECKINMVFLRACNNMLIIFPAVKHLGRQAASRQAILCWRPAGRQPTAGSPAGRQTAAGCQQAGKPQPAAGRQANQGRQPAGRQTSAGGRQAGKLRPVARRQANLGWRQAGRQTLGWRQAAIRQANLGWQPRTFQSVISMCKIDVNKLPATSEMPKAATSPSPKLMLPNRSEGE